MAIEAKYLDLVRHHDCFAPNSPYVSDAACHTFLDTCRKQFAQQPFNEWLLCRSFADRQIERANFYFFQTNHNLQNQEKKDDHIESTIKAVNCAIRKHFKKTMDEENLRGAILQHFNELAQHWCYVLGKEIIDHHHPTVEELEQVFMVIRLQVLAPVCFHTRVKIREYLESKQPKESPA